jgi:polar amino acid transport system substrate-binding protein
MNIKQIFTLLLTGLLLLSGCDNQQPQTENGEKKHVVIATSGSPSPFVTVNQNGELSGYDIDVAKAIFAELPQYSISFEIAEFPSVLAGLDSDRYQVGANNFAMNEQRQEKYFYTDPIFLNQYVIAVRANDQSIKSFQDLKGKSTETPPGLNYTTALENFNQSNQDNPVKIQYSEADLLPVLQNVANGKYDFQLIDRAMLEQFIKQYQLKLKVIELSKADIDRIGSPYSYLLVSKGNQGSELMQDINQGIKKIIHNGQLAKISQQYFGADYSPK